MFRLRAAVPAILLAAYSAYSLIGLLQSPIVLLDHARARGPVGHVFLRALPILNGVESVGFATEHAPKELAGDAAYFRAQYALAPIRVYQSLDHRYILGQFGSELALRDFLSKHDLALLASYPGGVVVLERR